MAFQIIILSFARKEMWPWPWTLNLPAECVLPWKPSKLPFLVDRIGGLEAFGAEIFLIPRKIE